MTTGAVAKGLKVVTTLKFSGEHWERLVQALAGDEILRFHDVDDPAFETALGEADIALLAADPDLRVLRAPRLRWVHVDHAGLNKAAKPEAFRDGLILTGSAGRSAPVLAEHALFFALALAYEYPSFLDAQRAHRWGVPGQDRLRGLFGRTMGIVGLGNTGTEIARRAKAFGMQVLGYRRRTAAAPPGVDRVFSAEARETLEPLLEQSDFVVLALGLSDATHHMIGAHELDRIGPSGYLINMARGAIVDENALLDALSNNRIAGAASDTFAREPLPADSPLWDAPRLLITPHVTPAMPDRTARSLDIICENIRRFRAGEAMINVLTPADIYKRA